MIVEAALRSLEALDQAVVDRAAELPDSLAVAINERLSQWPWRVRELAALLLAAHGAPASVQLLVKLTADQSLQVASAAARSLADQTNLPPGDALLEVLPSRSDPYVRQQLYLAAGRADCSLEALRSVLKAEPNPRVAAEGLAVAVRRGGDLERRHFFDAVRHAEAEDVAAYQARLLYVGDPKLAKALLPWLSSEAPVTRASSDRSPEMIRMCDFAVAIAHSLGLPVRLPEDGSGVLPSAIIRAARPVLEALPDPD